MRAPTRIVITRAQEPGAAWQRRLVAAGVEVLLLPLIRYESLPLPEKGGGSDQDWLLFTSPQGARAYFAGGGREADSSGLAALGDGTAAELAALGHPVQLNLAVSDGAAMAVAFATQIAAPARLLLPGAERRMSEPAATLRATGFTVTELPIYRTLPVSPNQLPADPFRDGDCLFFASPSAVAAFRQAWPHADVDCAAIGATSAAACRAAGLAPRVAERPDLDSLCAAVGLNLTGAVVTSDSDPGGEHARPA